jgi:glucokinase
MHKGKWSIGIDIGGTKVSIAQVDTEGNILQKKMYPTIQKDGYQGVVHNIVRAINELKNYAGTAPIGIGIGMAGQINPKNGVVHFAPNLSWHEVPLQEMLMKQLSLPVLIAHDVRVATWAEWKHGAGKGCDNFVCMLIGTGIGGGIVSEGELLNGSSYTIGELGHIIVDLNGPICTCGNQGCLEAIAGGWGIAKSGGVSSAKEIIAAYRNQDPKAKMIIENVKKALCAGGITIVHAFNPKKLIIGGGVVKGLPEIIDWIRDGIEAKALKAAIIDFEVVQTQLGDDAGLIGAADMALHAFGKP